MLQSSGQSYGYSVSQIIASKAAVRFTECDYITNIQKRQIYGKILGIVPWLTASNGEECWQQDYANTA